MKLLRQGRTLYTLYSRILNGKETVCNEYWMNVYADPNANISCQTVEDFTAKIENVVNSHDELLDMLKQAKESLLLWNDGRKTALISEIEKTINKAEL